MAVFGGALGGGGLVALLMAGALMGPPSSAAPDHTPPAANEARTAGAGLPPDASRQPSAPQRNSLGTTAADPLNRSILSGPASSSMSFQAPTPTPPSDGADPFSSLLKDLLSGGRELATAKGTGPLVVRPDDAGTGRGHRKAGAGGQAATRP